MADLSAAILTFPSKTVEIQYDEERRFYAFGRRFRFGWRRITRRFVIRALPVAELHQLEQLLESLRQVRGGEINLAEVCTVIVGRQVRSVPRRALQAIYDAYLEVNELSPKAEPAASPSPLEISSAGSSDTPSTSPSPTPSA